jgi:hypothetical protein
MRLLARSAAMHRVRGITHAIAPAAVLAGALANPTAVITLRALIKQGPLHRFSGVRMFGIFIPVSRFLRASPREPTGMRRPLNMLLLPNELGLPKQVRKATFQIIWQALLIMDQQEMPRIPGSMHSLYLEPRKKFCVNCLYPRHLLLGSRESLKLPSSHHAN